MSLKYKEYKEANILFLKENLKYILMFRLNYVLVQFCTIYEYQFVYFF